jgi:hypothetical protein
MEESLPSGLAHQQIIELLPADSSVPVLVGPANHALQIFLAEILPDLQCDPAQVPHADEPGLLSVEQGEDLVDVVASVVLQQPRRQQVDELFEGDVAGALAVQVQNDLVDAVGAGFGSEGGEGGLEFWIGGEVPAGLMEPTCSRS